ncbi:MAG: hypothetical protein EXR80_01445 [Methylococcales bacterium]|nr:hypothetical protein [Methylococcales bacterium]
MNKQDWLEEAVKYIDSLNSEEFEDFIMSCVTCYAVKMDYSDIKIGKKTVFSDTTLAKSANMDIYYAETMSLAA